MSNKLKPKQNMETWSNYNFENTAKNLIEIAHLIY